MDPIRRNILATGVAAAATAAAPHVFAQQADQRGAFKFYEKGNVRIRYQEVGNGFPFLVTPGGGLNSRISNWQTAVINAMEEFKNDFRCITMDQRNDGGINGAGGVEAGACADAANGIIAEAAARPAHTMRLRNVFLRISLLPSFEC